VHILNVFPGSFGLLLELLSMGFAATQTPEITLTNAFANYLAVKDVTWGVGQGVASYFRITLAVAPLRAPLHGPSKEPFPHFRH
jgi:hypothetical protein